MQRFITDWLVAGSGPSPANQPTSIARRQQTAPARSPIAIGTLMSSIRRAHPVTGQLRRRRDLPDPPAPRRSRRVAGEAPESGPYTPQRRQSRQAEPPSQSHPPLPSSAFTFVRSEPLVPPPGFSHSNPLTHRPIGASDHNLYPPIAPNHNPPTAALSMDEMLDASPKPELDTANDAAWPSATRQSHQARLDFTSTSEPMVFHANNTLPERTVKPERKKECEICLDGDGAVLLQPCRVCDIFYCSDCLKTLFLNAADDLTMMPPKCCATIQISAVLPYLSPAEADRYRAKFEEWMTPHKTYCPVPKCSEFIPDRFVLHPPKSAGRLGSTLDKEVPRILNELMKSPHSRFLRYNLSPGSHGVPEFFKTVKRPIFLETIIKKLHSYKSLGPIFSDFHAMIDTTRRFPERHPVAESGVLLRDLFYQELGKISTESFASLVKLPPNASFSCLGCHIAICAECKQVAHPGQVCDTTAKDQEAAMLSQFGYKKCPKCGHGVRRMFGCRHMQCLCGAHWCYRCLRPIDDCDGACSPLGPESDDEYYSDEDLDPVHEAAQRHVPRAAPHPQQSEAVVPDPSPVVALPRQPVAVGTSAPSLTSPVNLDAGGDRIWAGSGINFGEEPGEEVQDMMWSCQHNFHRAHLNTDAIKRGVPLETECYRCFDTIRAISTDEYGAETIKDRIKAEHTRLYHTPLKEEEDEPNKAWQCLYCEIILCTKCEEAASAR